MAGRSSWNLSFNRPTPDPSQLQPLREMCQQKSARPQRVVNGQARRGPELRPRAPFITSRCTVGAAKAPGTPPMRMDLSQFDVKLAETGEEVAAAQRLRYRVFVEEMGAPAAGADHASRLETDAYDPHCAHLLLIDRFAGSADPLDRVVGAYRLMTDRAAAAGIGYYGASEYDLTPIERSGRRAVELGRSCVAAPYRSGLGLHLLWNGVARFVLERRIEILFGVASFHGTDPDAIAPALTHLARRHMAPPALRVRARPPGATEMDRIDGPVEPKCALRQVPALIKSYLRLGGVVGEGAWVDPDFNTIDVCVVMDTARMSRRYHDYFRRHSL